MEAIRNKPAQRFVLPDHFATPETGNELRPEDRQATHGEDRMMPPVGECFPCPAEQRDFGSRSGDIAEMDFAPEYPAADRNCGADKEGSKGAEHAKGIPGHLRQQL